MHAEILGYPEKYLLGKKFCNRRLVIIIYLWLNLVLLFTKWCILSWSQRVTCQHLALLSARIYEPQLLAMGNIHFNQKFMGLWEHSLQHPVSISDFVPSTLGQCRFSHKYYSVPCQYNHKERLERSCITFQKTNSR